MKLMPIKAVIAGLWVATVVLAGTAGNLNSFSSWAVLGVLALVPPFVITMWRWNEPRQTMSETIQEALR